MSAESLCRKDREFQPLKLSTFPDSRRASAARFVLTGAAICALPSFASGYAMTLAVEVMNAGVFASGINLLIGYTGLVSLGQAMFLGLGGYGIAVGTALLGWPLWASAAITLVVVAMIAAAIGAICTRTRGVEFLLITLAFSQMFYGAAIKLRWTNGSDGMTGIPRPDLSLLGVSADDPVVFYYYVACAAALAFVALALIVRSPFGSVLIAIRESERRAQAMGYAVGAYKIGAFGISGVVCSLAGVLQAQYTYFINPDSMSWQSSGEGILMVIIGGAGAILGPFGGGAVLVLGREGLSLVSGEDH